MKTRQEIFEMRVATWNAEYEWKKVYEVTANNDYWIWEVARLLISAKWEIVITCTEVLFSKSNFWEVMYDNEYFIDYLPAVQVCNEIDAYAPLWYKACCAVSDDYLEFLDKVVKCTDN